MAVKRSHWEDCAALVECFQAGARRGLTIALNTILPGVVLAFVLIQALSVSGGLSLIGYGLAPIMGWWGLPGEAAMVLVAAALSISGAAGAIAGLFAAGQLDALQVSILTPAIFLMGALIQFANRILGTARVARAYWLPMMVICVVNALLSMSFMRFLMGWL